MKIQFLSIGKTAEIVFCLGSKRPGSKTSKFFSIGQQQHQKQSIPKTLSDFDIRNPHL